MSRRIQIALGIAFLVSSSTRVIADGIIQTLPENGRWAKFDMEIIVHDKDGKPKVTTTGSYTIRSVGQEIVGKEVCRRIELDMEFVSKTKTGQPKPFREIFHLVIPENRFTGVNDPAEHFIKGWQKYPSRMGIVSRVEPRILRDGILTNEFHGQLENVKELEPRMVHSKLGDLKCFGKTGTRVKTFPKVEGMEDHYRYTARLNDRSPFGVVEFESEFHRKLSNGQITKPRIFHFLLKETGSNAKPEITNEEILKAR